MTTTLTEPVVETTAFDAAREILKSHGWGRGAYVDPNTGHYCLVGAVRAAVLGEPKGETRLTDEDRVALEPYEAALVSTLAEMFPETVDPADSIGVAMLWNDSQGVTPVLVDEVLTRASSKLT